MAHGFAVDHAGGPEVLSWRAVPAPAPGPGQARIRHTAIGLNYIDIYFRSGVYPVAGFPFTPGMEAAGVVDAVGEGVEHVRVGDRVAYAARVPGAYCESRTMAADALVALPDGIADDIAAAMMLKGMTAQYLLKQTRPIGPGDTILFHAAAGGVGLIACQWAHHLGARVLGTVGSAEKATLARAHGCDEVINYASEDFVARVKTLTGGRGVDVVYDGVGKATFEGSLDCLRTRGMLVMFGQSSGKVPPFDITVLSGKGSLYLTRPTLFNYTATREALQACAQDLFDVVLRGTVKIPIGQRFPLREAAEAHRALEARRTIGATVLTL